MNSLKAITTPRNSDEKTSSNPTKLGKSLRRSRQSPKCRRRRRTSETVTEFVCFIFFTFCFFFCPKPLENLSRRSESCQESPETCRESMAKKRRGSDRRTLHVRPSINQIGFGSFVLWRAFLDHRSKTRPIKIHLDPVTTSFIQEKRHNTLSYPGKPSKIQ